MRTFWRALAVGLAVVPLAGTAVVAAEGPGARVNLSPAEWKLTLPTGDDTKADEVSDFSGESAPWFRVDPAMGAARFGSRADGARTSSGTKYPRTELREMAGRGVEAAWETDSGVHILSARLAVTEATPARSESAPRISLLQIHEGQEFSGSSDILQILYDNTTEREAAAITYRAYGESRGALIPDYVLGSSFKATIAVASNQVTVWINDVQLAQFDVDPSRASAYFKAGTYLQFSVNDVNRTPGVEAGDYGEVAISGLSVIHREAGSGSLRATVAATEPQPLIAGTEPRPVIAGAPPPPAGTSAEPPPAVPEAPMLLLLPLSACLIIALRLRKAAFVPGAQEPPGG